MAHTMDATRHSHSGIDHRARPRPYHFHALHPATTPRGDEWHLAPLLSALGDDDARQARPRADRDRPGAGRYVPPAQLADKAVLSPWSAGLAARLEAGTIDTIVVTGAETEVCVLATVMGAIDRGYRVIV